MRALISRLPFKMQPADEAFRIAGAIYLQTSEIADMSHGWVGFDFHKQVHQR